MNIKTIYLIFFFTAFVTITGFTNDKETFENIDFDKTQNSDYQYFINLKAVKEDKVKVELITPKIKKNSIKFHFPKIIPGTYTVYDFGRFVSQFQAYNQAGELLKTRHPDVNTWVIENAKSLYKITYWVDDTFDATGGKPVSGMSGSNIEADKNFVLNGHAFYGYFEGKKQEKFSITIDKPRDFYGASPVQSISTGSGMDIYQFASYNALADTPMMYCRPDTATIKVGNAEVLIAVHSPTSNVKAKNLAKPYQELLYAQRDYLGGTLPVQRYAFLMYFLDPETQSIGTGALEHNYSSLYVMPDYPQDQIQQFLVDIAAHEFFHIVTPLNVHSKEIHYFDFNEPDMSKHLWMYEGVTEYFAHHAQVREGLTTPEQFLATIGQKILQSQTLYKDDLPFTELSAECLDKYADQYGNVYQKGALIGMCLDIELLRLSKGTYGMVDLMEDLSQKYGAQKPFKDKCLFKAIKKMTYPAIYQFLQTYVAGKKVLPLAEIFQKAGVQYEAPKPTQSFTLGNVNLGFNSETQRLFVNNTYSLNEFGRALGYQVGDEIYKVGGKVVPSTGINDFIQSIMSKMKEDQLFEIEVYRKNAAGEPELLTLSAVTKKVKSMSAPTLTLMEHPTTQQLKLREAWLGATSKNLSQQ